MHSLPSLFDLPYPSFRLFNSIKEIDKLYNTDFFKQFKKLFSFKNNNSKIILENFKQAYLLMNKIKQNENVSSKNLGFYDEIKINYNLDGLKRTFKNYPFFFAYRFILSCITMWTFETTNTNLTNTSSTNTSSTGLDKLVLENLFYKIIGLNKLNKKIVEKKLIISEKIVKKSILLQSKIKK